MKRVLVIALALICTFAAQAQMATLKPISVYKVPNISHATYTNGTYNNEDNPLFWELHCGPGNFNGDKVVASSELNSQGTATYRASNINDWNHETAWVEGVSGYGIGQWIEFQNFEVEGTFTAIQILNGYVKSDKAWSENARVKRLKVYCNGKPICILELQDSRSLQSFNVNNLLGSVRYIKSLRFEILEVYPGTKYQDTVIAEIVFSAAS